MRIALFRISRKLQPALILLVLVGSAAAQDHTVAIDQARTTLEKWVETERLLSKERRELSMGRELLGDRIAVVRREIATLQGKIADAQASIATADEKRAELLEENEQLEQASESLLATVVEFEAQMHALLPRLPQPVRDRVRPLSQRLPQGEEPVKLSLSERFQNVVGILNEVDKFNRELTVLSEVVTLEDGTSLEVTSVYLGIGQAYYVGASETVAGMGTASSGKWEWMPANDYATTIAQAIAILKNEQMATFVPIPIEID